MPFEVLAPLMGHADTRMPSRVYANRTTAELAAAVARATGVDCDNGVRDSLDSAGLMGRRTPANPSKTVPRDGIEPSTRGFSVRRVIKITYRKDSKNSKAAKRIAPPVPHPAFRIVGGKD